MTEGFTNLVVGAVRMCRARKVSDRFSCHSKVDTFNLVRPVQTAIGCGVLNGRSNDRCFTWNRHLSKDFVWRFR